MEGKWHASALLCSPKTAAAHADTGQTFLQTRARCETQSCTGQREPCYANCTNAVLFLMGWFKVFHFRKKINVVESGGWWWLAEAEGSGIAGWLWKMEAVCLSLAHTSKAVTWLRIRAQSLLEPCHKCGHTLLWSTCTVTQTVHVPILGCSCIVMLPAN